MMVDAGSYTFILRCQEARIEPFVCFDHVCSGSGQGAYLDDLSFEIGQGDLVALVGPGTAGKTLLLRLILGLGQPDSGTISVFGEDPVSAIARQRVGAVLETTDFPPNLKVREIVHLVSSHYPNPYPVDDLVVRFGIEDDMDRPAGSLSGANQRVLSVMLSMVGQPDGLVMDNPTTGMEIGWRYQFWNLLLEYTRTGRPAIISTDVMHDVETYATRIMVLHAGRIVADGTADEIREASGRQTQISSPLADAGIIGPDAIRTAQQASLEREWVHPQSLEQVVLQLTDEASP